MTAHDTPRNGRLQFGSTVAAGDILRGAGEWARRLLIAFTVILAAGILAVATAIFGLILAAMAIVMRFAGRGSRFEMRRAKADTSTLTLDARRTARGWTVE